MAIEQVKLENLLKEKFPDANILVKDLEEIITTTLLPLSLKYSMISIECNNIN